MAFLTGDRFIRRLAELGIVDLKDGIQRVIIDAAYDDALIVYIQRIGDDRILELCSDDFVGVRITTAERDADNGNE